MSLQPDKSDSLGQIKALLAGETAADDFRFRMELEAMLRRGGREAEDLFHHYMAAGVLPERIRLNLIRISGYWQKPRFLSALKKVIELEVSAQLKREAVLSVAKYRERRALDILDQVLEKTDDLELAGLLRRQIGLMRRHSPLLALMPGFLAGSRDRDRCRVTVKVLGKILPAADSRAFIPHLADPDTEISGGAFEILCRRGDESAWVFLLENLRAEWRRVGAAANPENFNLNKRAGLLLFYCLRFPDESAARLAELSFLPEAWLREEQAPPGSR